jgi:DNA replication protein DnaC
MSFYRAIPRVRTPCRDNPIHAIVDTMPAGTPDPHRSGYIITDAPCLDCASHSWAVPSHVEDKKGRVTKEQWYVSPWCHQCLNDDALGLSRSRHAQQDRASDLQRYHNAGLTDADLAVTWPLQEQLKRMTRSTYSAEWCAYLLGSTGTGKTSQALAAVKHYVSKGWRCRYLTERDLFRLLRPVDGAPRTTPEQIIDYDLLVLDEFGSAGRTDWQHEVMRDVIDGRYRARRPTIFASNHSMRVLSAKAGLGRIIIERIFEGLNAHEKGVKDKDSLYLEYTYSHRIGCKVELPEGALGLRRAAA